MDHEKDRPVGVAQLLLKAQGVEALLRGAGLPEGGAPARKGSFESSRTLPTLTVDCLLQPRQRHRKRRFRSRVVRSLMW